MAVEIASGSLEDLEAISEIYAHYVRTSAISFDVEVPSAVWRREWFTVFDTRGRHRLLVIRSQGRAVGYAASVPYRPRAAYAPRSRPASTSRRATSGRGWARRCTGRCSPSSSARTSIERTRGSRSRTRPRCVCTSSAGTAAPVTTRSKGASSGDTGMSPGTNGPSGGGVHDLRVRGWTWPTNSNRGSTPCTRSPRALHARTGCASQGTRRGRRSRRRVARVKALRKPVVAAWAGTRSPARSRRYPRAHRARGRPPVGPSPSRVGRGRRAVPRGDRGVVSS